MLVLGLVLGYGAYNETRHEQDLEKMQQETNRMVEILGGVPAGTIDVEREPDYTNAIARGAIGIVVLLSGVIVLATTRDLVSPR